MIHALTSLIGAVAAVVLISAALVYIVSPKHGSELLRRLAIFLGGAFLGLCLLQQFSVHIGPLSLMLLGFAIMVTAYFIFEARRRHPRRALPRRGAERLPVLPPSDEESSDE
jgi:Ca2+/Na+ antiporter